MTSSDEAKRCDNLACLCQVALVEAVCSTFCDSPEARDPSTVRCTCGHQACEEQIEAQLHGRIGKESLS